MMPLNTRRRRLLVSNLASCCPIKVQMVTEGRVIMPKTNATTMTASALCKGEYTVIAVNATTHTYGLTH